MLLYFKHQRRLMARIQVHILNFHGPWSHTELLLENLSKKPHTYYFIDRWSAPENHWHSYATPEIAQQELEKASAIYSFEIKANARSIMSDWKIYWRSTEKNAFILGDNCGVATQWFLQRFAGVPKLDLSNISLNHFVMGIFWPSFVPCPVTLPGRVMSHAKFHLNIKNNPEKARQYSQLFLYTCFAISLLTISVTLFELSEALNPANPTPTISPIITTMACAAGTYGFFNTYNLHSAKQIANDLKKSDAIQENSNAPTPFVFDISAPQKEP